MFARRSPTDQPQFAPNTPNGSKGGQFFMADDAVVLAAADGTIWSSSVTPGGISIVVDHGKPWATYYQHLSRALVPMAIAAGRGGIRVARGQPIGIVGGSPLDGEHLKHLHFEMWKGGAGGAHVDPQLHGFDSWPVLESGYTSERGVAARNVLETIAREGVRAPVVQRDDSTRRVLAAIALVGGLALAGVALHRIGQRTT
jgi:hypothetical protein